MYVRNALKLSANVDGCNVVINSSVDPASLLASFKKGWSMTNFVEVIRSEAIGVF